MTEDKSSFPICPHGQILIPVPTVTVHEGADDYSRNAARWCRLTPEETTDPLTSYRVDHAITLGFPWKQIDALRPPAVIEGFARFELDRYAFQCVSETEVETTRNRAWPNASWRCGKPSRSMRQ